MTDEEINQAIDNAVQWLRKRRTDYYADDGQYQPTPEVELLDSLASAAMYISDKLAEQEKEIERLKDIEKAAADVCYYQGTEGSAERLERLLRYPEEQGK